jgi:hypothetical protein
LKLTGRPLLSAIYVILTLDEEGFLPGATRKRQPEEIGEFINEQLGLANR